jgi:hypothetical protein
MHAVRRTLVEAQAQRTDLPLWAIDLPWPCSNAIYEELMSGVLRRAAAEQVTAIAFGDLFLNDIRKYRNGNSLERVSSHCFPCGICLPASWLEK